MWYNYFLDMSTERLVAGETYKEKVSKLKVGVAVLFGLAGINILLAAQTPAEVITGSAGIIIATMFWKNRHYKVPQESS